MTTTVRINEKTRDKLRELSRQTGRPISQLVDDAVEELRRAWILDATNDAYARLRADPVSWAEVLAERAEWDETLMDGLSDDG